MSESSSRRASFRRVSSTSTATAGQDDLNGSASASTVVGGGLWDSTRMAVDRQGKAVDVDLAAREQFEAWAEASRRKGYDEELREVMEQTRTNGPVNGKGGRGEAEDEDEVFVHDGTSSDNPFASAGPSATYDAQLDEVLGRTKSPSDGALGLPALGQNGDPRSPALSSDSQRLLPPTRHPLSISVSPSSASPPHQTASMAAMLSRSTSTSQSHPVATSSKMLAASTSSQRPPPAPLFKRPFNPQFSRLRSTSGRGAPLPRSVSNTSTLFSQTLILPGDRGEVGRPGSDIFSRHSSISNLHDIVRSPGEQPPSHQPGRGAGRFASSPTPSITGSDDASRRSVDKGKAVADSFNEGIFRWSSLKRISKRVFRGTAARAAPTAPAVNGTAAQPSAAQTLLGPPTVIAASGVIAVGTAKGWTTVFDYGSNLRCVLGSEAIGKLVSPETHLELMWRYAVKESGAVTSLAISHDHSFIAVGHARGAMHLYELAKPGSPYRSVMACTPSSIASGRREGHLEGSKVIHLGFVGARHTALVSADETGLAFYHSLGKVLGLASTDIVRILGKYPDHVAGGTEGGSGRAGAGTPVPSISGAATTAWRSIAGADRRLRQPSEQSTSTNGSIDGASTPLSRGGRRKPTTAFGASPLPLGPAAHPTDPHALVALLTPAKLVIVGLKPTPRTWWRAARGTAAAGGGAKGSESGGAAEARTGEWAAQTGAVAWFPSSVIKDTADIRGHEHDGTTVNGADDARGKPMDPIVAFAWGRTVRFVTVLADGVVRDRGDDAEARLAGFGAGSGLRAVSLRFVEGKAWIAGAPVVGVQWLNWRIICLLTTSGFEIVDTQIWQKTGSDPISLSTIAGFSVQRDIFPVANGSVSDYDPSRLVAGAVRAYKGKVFMLTTTDLRLGIIMSWADRILALVDEGSLVEAIELATLFWNGRADSETIGLPSDDVARHAVVRPKLREIMSASLDYVFSEERMRDDTHYDPDGRGVDRTMLFQGLAAACIQACLTVGELDFAFDDVFDRYSDNGIQTIFLDQLEPFVLRSEIRSPPTLLVQKLIALAEEREQFEDAEQIIWHVDPTCLDINQALRLCQRQGLYDAMVYVYTQAMADFVAPLVELLGLVRQIQTHRKTRPQRIQGAEEGDYFGVTERDAEVERSVPDAYKSFAYISATLSGLAYPTQAPLSADAARPARKSLYNFLLAGRSVQWPLPHGKLVLTVEEGQPEPLYPYLRLLLGFDAEAMLDALDVAFEDPYLNDAGSKRHVSRQSIVDILLEIMRSTDFGPADRTFIYIFVARNLPKFPQFVKLSDETAHDVLVSLAGDSDQSTREDRELAAEYLLSTYSPVFDADLLALLERAGFWRILRSVHRSEKRWASLVDAYVRDPESTAGDIFAHLPGVLGAAARASPETREAVLQVLLDATPQLVEAGIRPTALLINAFFPSAHARVVAALEGAPTRQFAYLRALLEPSLVDDQDTVIADLPTSTPQLDHSQRLGYLSLLCDYDPGHVVDYLASSAQESGEDVRALCEDKEVFDAVVWQLDHEGDTEAALAFFDETATSRCDMIIASVLSGEASSDGRGLASTGANRWIEQIRAVVRASVKICVVRSATPRNGMRAEDVWLRLLATLTKSIHSCSTVLPTSDDGLARSLVDHARGQPVVDALRAMLSEALSVFIANTSLRQVSFPRLVRSLLEQAPKGEGEARGTAEFRSVVVLIMEVYRFEDTVLETTNRLLDGDLFEDLDRLRKGKLRGWRPGDRSCAHCRNPVWGPEAGIAAREGESDEPTIERLGLSKRPSFVRKKSLKGKEVELLDDVSHRPLSWQSVKDGVPPASLWLARGVAALQDGSVYHRSCWETVARSAIGA